MSTMQFINKNLPTETSERGQSGSSVFVRDQTTPLLSLPFLRERLSTTLASDATADGLNRDITLTSGHSTQVGEIIELADNNSNVFMQATVTGVALDVITLDAPINFPYLAASSVVVVSSDDMNVDGLSTPQVFRVAPLPEQAGDMVRVIFEMRDNVAMDFDTFGGLAGLLNGIVIRIKLADGTYKNLHNFKSNGDIGEACYDISYQENNGGGTRGFLARLTWEKFGAVIRLDGNLNEELQVVIQDDLTGLLRFHMTVQGHELQET